MVTGQREREGERGGRTRPKWKGVSPHVPRQPAIGLTGNGHYRRQIGPGRNRPSLEPLPVLAQRTETGPQGCLPRPAAPSRIRGRVTDGRVIHLLSVRRR